MAKGTREPRVTARSDENEGRFFQGLEKSDDAVVGFDLNGRLLAWNKGAERLFSMRRTEAIGSCMARFFRRRRDAETFEHLKTDLFDKGRSTTAQITIKAKDEMPVEALVTATPISHPVGKPSEAVAILKDVGSFKEAWLSETKVAKANLEKRLRQKVEQLTDLEQAYRGFLERAPDFVFILDRRGRFRFCNAKVKAITGYESSELIGRPFSGVLKRVDSRQAFPLSRTIMSGHPVQRVVLQIRRKDGALITVELDTAPGSCGHRIRGIMGIARDISERHEMEKVLKAEKTEANRLAKELERAIKGLQETQQEMLSREKALATGELAGALAHEIRNPLCIISMSVQYLQSKFDATDPRREFTEAIIRKVQKLDSITQRLVSYGRDRELHLGWRNLHRCLDRNVGLIKAQCKNQGIAIVRRYSRRLPLVRIDEEMIDEVVSNLLMNAVEAMPRGGRLTLETAQDRNRNLAVIKVSDTGNGIPLANHRQLFKPFFSTKKAAGGTGLGLAISYRIIADHGGTVQVQSRVSGRDRGTTFTIRLPNDDHQSLNRAEENQG